MIQSPLRFLTGAVSLATLTLITPCLFAQGTASTAGPSGETVTLNAFTVSTDQDNGYKATNSIGATRTNAAIVDTPQSISVFNDLFIQDTLSNNLTDLTAYNSSFLPTQPDKGTYLARGFSVNATFVDGLTQRNTFGPNYTENIDRVEILQGPAAVLYGAGGGGATVNRVLKRAIPHSFTNVGVSVGDETFQRGTLDTGGALPWKIGGRSLAYRANVALQDGNTFKLLSKNREELYSPAFFIPLTSKTDLYLNFTYDRTDLSGNFAQPVFNGVPGQVNLPAGGSVHVPIENSFGESLDDRPITKTLSSYDLTHVFNEHLSFRSQYQFETYEQRDSEVFPQIGQYVYTTTTASIRRLYRAQYVDYKADRLREELLGDFTTGPLHHKFLGGFSFDETNERDLYRQNTTAAVPVLDMVNPLYGGYAKPELSTIPVATNQQIKNIIGAWYANELVSIFNERLFVQAGVRTEDYYQRTNNRLRSVSAAVLVRANTSSFGAVYHLDPAKKMTLWSSISSSFEPNFQVNPDSSTLPPTTGKTFEEGLKFDLFNRTTEVNFSNFHTVRENLPMAAPDLGDGFFRPGPGQLSQGYQVDVTYNPSRALQLYGSYAYLDAYTTATKVSIPNAPQSSFSGFARYERLSGALKGVFATVGYIYRGTRDPGITVGSTNAFWHVPTFKELNLGLGYGWRMGKIHYDAIINVTNAADELLFSDNSLNDRYAMLAPRAFQFSLRLKL